MSNDRKKCSSCGKPLMRFMGLYLHPESPCSGITDSIHIEGVIEDEFIYEKWKSEYGSPQKSDYEAVTELEIELENLKLKLRNPLVRIAILIIRSFKGE